LALVRCVIDTNILVYAQDPRTPAKRRVARALLTRLAESGDAVLPAQALSEFASVQLTKVKPAPDTETVSTQIGRLEAAFEVLPLTAVVIAEALRGVRQHRLSYYDAQIWAVAHLAQARMVVSEDFKHGATIEGVTFQDPFQPGVVVA
jgi:predicted nucleic acid-binding protein